MEAKKPEPASPGTGFADWLFRLATLLRLGPLVADIVLDPSGARLPHFLRGGILAVVSVVPASPSGIVQFVPDVVLRPSVAPILAEPLYRFFGHILSPPFLFLGLHRNKKTAPSFRAASPSKQNPA